MAQWKLFKQETDDPERYRMVDGTFDAVTAEKAVEAFVKSVAAGDYTEANLGIYYATPVRYLHRLTPELDLTPRVTFR